MKNNFINKELEVLSVEDLKKINGGNDGDFAYLAGRIWVHTTLAMLTNGLSIAYLIYKQ